MSRKTFGCLVLFMFFIVFSFANNNTLQKNLWTYISPLVGTCGEGNVFPGATVPHGMVQVSPDTDKWTWGSASGYEYSDKYILGFSMRHLSGTGIPDLGDFLIVPSVKKLKFKPGLVRVENKGWDEKIILDPSKGYCTPFSHKQEIAKAGYYSVYLPEYRINVELAATDRAGILRFTFPKTEHAYIMMDLSHVLQWKVL